MLAPLLLFFCASCAPLQHALTTPDPVTHEPPVATFFEAIPSLLVDPADPEGWGKVVGAAAATAAAIFGYKKLKGKKAPPPPLPPLPLANASSPYPRGNV